MAVIDFEVSDRKIPRQAELYPVRVFPVTDEPRVKLQELMGEIGSDEDIAHKISLAFQDKTTKKKDAGLYVDGVLIGAVNDNDNKILKSATDGRRVLRVHHIQIGQVREQESAYNMLFIVAMFVYYPSMVSGNSMAEPLPEKDLSSMAYIAKTNMNFPRSAIAKIEPEAQKGSEKFSAKLAGVTFPNADGSSRQHYLEQICEREHPFSDPENYVIYFDGYLFEGEPAIQIWVNSCCVGNISRSDLPTILRALEEKRILSVRELIVQPFINSDGDEVYTCKLILNLDAGAAYAPGAIQPAAKESIVDNVARCPYCGSTSVVPYRKPWNHGLAILGFFFFGIGILLGLVGKGGYRRCLNCNKHWK